jgi:hypothetical protein
MLARMDEINNISKAAVKIISTLREEINHKNGIAPSYNKLIIGRIGKDKTKRMESANDHKDSKAGLSPKQCC